ncbi:hypothetical protein [Candidatus Tisiphia endosymbiont of Empis tessellata]|uniref:hypothetical protein n=1 Tax=Candidatus Tisiphia endosymbiont of Empis tessellata TaxID=3066259 RepID=UPI00313F390B
MIIENQYKQNQIINTTTEDLKKMPDNEILKLLKEKLKVEKLEISMKQVKKFLYGEMYSTVAEQLGHKDAKALIKQYLHTDNSHPQTDKSHAFKVAAQDIVKDGGFYVVSVDELHNEVSQGLFTNKLKELFNTTHLKSKLQNSLNKKIEEISDEEIKKVHNNI